LALKSRIAISFAIRCLAAHLITFEAGCIKQMAETIHSGHPRSGLLGSQSFALNHETREIGKADILPRARSK
jgi:hypothetical protein